MKLIVSVSAAQPFKKGDKVIYKVANNEWYAGVIYSVGRSGNLYKVLANDGTIDTVKTTSIKPISIKGKKTAYTNAEASELTSVKTTPSVPTRTRASATPAIKPSTAETPNLVKGAHVLVPITAHDNWYLGVVTAVGTEKNAGLCKVKILKLNKTLTFEVTKVTPVNLSKVNGTPPHTDEVAKAFAPGGLLYGLTPRDDDAFDPQNITPEQASDITAGESKYYKVVKKALKAKQPVLVKIASNLWSIGTLEENPKPGRALVKVLFGEDDSHLLNISTLTPVQKL